MPPPGGTSGKLGDRYEGIWTVHELLELLADKASQMVVEPIGDDGIGIEFKVVHLSR